MNAYIKESSLREAVLDAAAEAAGDMERMGIPMTAIQTIEMIRTVTKQVAMRLVGASVVDTVNVAVRNVRVAKAPKALKVIKAPKAAKVAKAPKALKAAKAPKVAKDDTQVRIRNIAVEKGRVYLRSMKFVTPVTKQEPAVEPKFSVYHDYIVCLENGQRYKMLKRPLMTHFGMTPEQYKTKWGLPEGYPMVTAAHSDLKRQEAKAINLGHRTAEFREAARQRRDVASSQKANAEKVHA